ncbi:MAG: protein-disulfide reductase DsbD N-terminal domain-containing protein [Fibrobacteria bacterium]
MAAMVQFALLVAPILIPIKGHAQAVSSRPPPRLSFAYLSPSAQPGRPKSKASEDSLTLNVRIEIAEGWHINSDAPMDEFLVPTTLEIKSEGVEFGKPRYPRPEIQHNAIMGNLSLFSGTIDVEVPAKRLGRPSAGAPRTSVTLHYQSCNNSMCLPPKSITVEQ